MNDVSICRSANAPKSLSGTGICIMDTSSFPQGDRGGTRGQFARLLVIEDDQETADEIVSQFTEAGYEVRHAADGPQGLALAGGGGFDLIVMDRMLPGLDGLAILGALRQAQVSTPVILMSALGDVDERVRGLKAGGDDYLTKPFAMAE